jgi:hypothetical protein
VRTPRNTVRMGNGPKLTETMRPPGLAPEQGERWRDLISEFTSEIPDPSHVEMVLTDQYQQVAGEYAARAVNKMNEDLTAEQYSAVKVDGSVAAARTVELPDDQVVVIVAAAMLEFPPAFLRHSVLHELQHVRMIQHGDETFAVHRRLTFDLPRNEITWELLWMAESAIDEFRAERGVQERGLAAHENTITADDVAGVYRSFRAVRRDYNASGDLMSAYHGATLSLERLATHLAYGAAAIAAGNGTPDQWSQVPAMDRMINLLQSLPPADVTIPDPRLVDVAVQLAKELRQMLQAQGFDLFYTPGGSTYLKVR